MGSSKTGSLDKFAAFSPAAALASGKVKLPETGIIGMAQANQENKMNKGAQMAQQEDDEAAQYMQMMQQQSGMNMGMNMGGRVGFSEGSGPDMDRVLELEEQGFSYEEAFEKAMQERLDRGYNQGGRVEMGFGGSSGVATPQAGTTPGSPESLAALGNSGNMGNMLKQLFQQNPELYQSMQQPGMAAGGPVESMQFLKQHLPYQDGGHVALRRKMFKMGGPVNTHGVGITSGLEFRNNYNAGGSVRQNFSKAGAVKKLIELAKKIPGAKATGNQVEALKGVFGERGIKSLSDYIKSGVIDKKAVDALLASGKGAKGAPAVLTDPSKLRMLGRTIGLTGTAAAPLAALSTPFGRLSEEERETASDLSKGFDTARGGAEFLSSFNPALAGIDLAGMGADTLYEASQEDPDYLNTASLPDMFRKYVSGSQRGTSTPAAMDETLVASKVGRTQEELAAINEQQKMDNMQATMARYAELMEGSDNRDKLGMLGDSLIAGGSALMEGEGYGAAGRAFNEPLSASRRSREERMDAVNQMGAQAAMTEQMTVDSERRAIVNEFLKVNDFSDAEASQLYNLAVDANVSKVVPKDEDGELDVDTLLANPGVYADPTNLIGKGTVFVAVDSAGNYLPTNDPEEARTHAAG